ncbi:ABC transporter permease [Candidatus Acetothermia bacterium]|nr:ABC transporter permease [Candidatus Acetothermia bacterium]MBI3643124.1 ABC transporter permease [Candidatus Acetothermia bacterium]
MSEDREERGQSTTIHAPTSPQVHNEFDAVPSKPLTQEPLSQGQLIWRNFKRHRLGMLGGIVIILLALSALFADFLGPYSYATRHNRLGYAPPTPIHFFRDGNLTWPFVFGIKHDKDPDTSADIFSEVQSQEYPIRLFVQGDSYSLLGIFSTNIHLFGTGEPEQSTGQLFLFGTDLWGRDLLSRTLIGGRVSLAIGPAVLIFSLFVGILLGGISGYYGRWVDMLIQRLIEVLQSFPALPLFLALAAVLPPSLPNSYRFWGIVLIFSLLGWTFQARVLRGQFLALREQEFTLAAKAMGSSDLRVIFRHLLPNAISFVIVSATLAIPSLIIAEATLSFLDLGIKEPMTSWGALLNGAQQWSVLMSRSWLMIPGIFIVVTVLAFNFLGDALRDAIDPYSSNRG